MVERERAREQTERIERQEKEKEQKERRELNKRLTERANRRSEMVEKLGEMSAIKKIQDGFELERKKEEEEEVRRKVSEYQNEQANKTRHSVERRLANKEQMLSEIGRAQEEKKKRAELLLDRREFALNRKKLNEMGIESLEGQEAFILSQRK